MKQTIGPPSVCKGRAPQSPVPPSRPEQVYAMRISGRSLKETACELGITEDSAREYWRRAVHKRARQAQEGRTDAKHLVRPLGA